MEVGEEREKQGEKDGERKENVKKEEKTGQRL